MRRPWKYTVSLSLGLLATPAWAGGPDTPLASLGRPVASLGRPVATPHESIPSVPVSDPNVLPTAFDAPSLTLPDGKVRDQDKEPVRLAPRPPVFHTEPCSVKGPGTDGPVQGPAVEADKTQAPKPIPGARIEPEPLPAPRTSSGTTVIPGSTMTSRVIVSDGCDTSFAAACGTANCGHGNCRDGTDGCPQNEFYLGFEYLGWTLNHQHPPALVTTGSLADRANGLRAGALGLPGTEVLVGDKLAGGTLSGGRFTAGWWIDCDHTLALEGSVFFLGQRGQNFNFSSSSYPILGRPFFNPGVGEDVEFVAAPRLTTIQVVPPGLATAVPIQTLAPALDGSVSVNSFSRLWGAEANLRTQLCCEGWYHVDLIGGFRFLQLDEGLRITENLTLLQQIPGSTSTAVPVASQASAGFNPGDNFVVMDKFTTHNYFYGGQLGAEAEFRFCKKWFADVKGEVALGFTREIVNIEGATTFTPSQASAAAGLAGFNRPGGLLAQNSNIGRYSRDEFAVLPEVGIKIGYQFNECVRLYAGYNMMYLSNVVRPGQQIDRVVDTAQLSGGTGTRPAFQFHSSGLWAQGVNVGLEFRF